MGTATRVAAAREGQAERMMDDPRAKTKIREFLFTWLHANPEMDIEKDAEKYPGFDEHLASDLRASLELFLDDIVWSEKSDFRDLLLSDEVYLNDRLAKFFDVKAENADQFVPVKLDEGKRAGVLTHPYLMAINAHETETSPIHRGVFIVRGGVPGGVGAGHGRAPAPDPHSRQDQRNAHDPDRPDEGRCRG